MQSLLFLSLLLLVPAVLYAQRPDAAARPDRILTLDMDGGGRQQFVEVYTSRFADDPERYGSASLRLSGINLWTLPDSMGAPHTLEFSVVRARRDDQQQQILVAGTFENDYMEHWIVAWTGSAYRAEKVAAWGPIKWKEDGTFTSQDWFGFCRVQRLWNYDPATGVASLAAVDSSHFAEPVKVTIYKPLKLTRNRGSGKTITLAKRSKITIDAIDTRGSSAGISPSWGDAWLRIRAGVKTGWARVADVAAVAELPWAG